MEKKAKTFSLYLRIIHVHNELFAKQVNQFQNKGLVLCLKEDI